MCRSVLEVGSLGAGRWWADASVDGHPVPVHVAGVTAPTATAVARALAGLRRPGGSGRRRAAAPVAVTDRRAWPSATGRRPIDDPIAIAAGWRGAGADPAPVAALGATADGVVEVDLARDGPHALVAGTTGSGKSELLRTLVVVARRPLQPGPPDVRARRLQGRLDVRRLRRPAAHRRARHRPRRRARRPGPRQPRRRGAPARAACCAASGAVDLTDHRAAVGGRRCPASSS